MSGSRGPVRCCDAKDLVPLWLWPHLFPLIERTDRRNVADVVAAALVAHLHRVFAAGSNGDSPPTGQIKTASRLGTDDAARWDGAVNVGLVTPRYPVTGFVVMVLAELEIDKHLVSPGSPTLQLGRMATIAAVVNSDDVTSIRSVEQRLAVWLSYLPSRRVTFGGRRQALRSLQHLWRACEEIEASRRPLPYVITPLEQLKEDGMATEAVPAR